jgi:bilin biosynthesis protein
MLKNLTVAAVLLVLTAPGCTQQGESRKSPGGGAKNGAAQRPLDASGGAIADKAKAPVQPADQADASKSKEDKEGAKSKDGGAKANAADAPKLDPAVQERIQPLLVQMASDASVERQAAAEQLDAMGAAAMPYLAGALTAGTDAEKRGAAAFLIGRVALDDKATLEALIGLLNAPDEVLRHSVLQAVEKLPDEQLSRALPALTALAKNPQEEMPYRVRAVRAVAKMGEAGREAMPELLELVRDDANPDLQRAAIDAVAKVGTPEQSEAFFLELLKTSAQKDLRRLAARRLIQVVQSPQAVQGLIAAFNDSEAEVRNEAIEALVAIGRPAVPHLIEALDNSNVQIRRRAVLTLGKLNTLAATAVPALQKKLQDEDPEVRALVAASLRLIQGR